MLRPIESRVLITTLRRRTLLTEPGLSDEVPGHGEHMFLACLVIADGFGIHLGLYFSTARNRTLSAVTAHPDE